MSENKIKSFSTVLDSFDKDKIKKEIFSVSEKDFFESLARAKSEKGLTYFDLISFLSPIASEYLEEMAIVASDIHRRYFGKAITLYQPLYISNYCENECLYCGFNCKNKISRRQLTLEEIEKEAVAISSDGEIKQILLLTGEAPNRAGLDYILSAVEILKKYFDSVSIEVYPMAQNEYEALAASGVDGLTVYQEAYDREIYERVHPRGKKSDFLWRLDTPMRASLAGIRQVGIGALFGLGDCHTDAFFAATHAKYLQDNFLSTEFALSLPRFREATGDFVPTQIMSDKLFVQTLLAFRLYLPRVSINVSTRETKEMRNNILGLGVNKLSAGSRTSVGGYAVHLTEDQFEMADNRTVSEVKRDLKQLGFQPVHKDWQFFA